MTTVENGLRYILLVNDLLLAFIGGKKSFFPTLPSPSSLLLHTKNVNEIDWVWHCDKMAEEVEFVSDEDVPHFKKCGFRPTGRFWKIYQVPLYALTVVSTVESLLVNLKTLLNQFAKVTHVKTCIIYRDFLATYPPSIIETVVLVLFLKLFNQVPLIFWWNSLAFKVITASL